jgi:hypothetical protein
MVRAGISNRDRRMLNRCAGNESSRTGAVIVLDKPQTQSQAARACAAIGETLWTPSADLGSNNFLSYLAYKPGVQARNHSGPPHHGGGWGGNDWHHEQLYHTAGQSSRGCQAITPAGKTITVGCNAQLPALCTQSAALSTINGTDTSARFQTSVTSGKAVYTGFRDKLTFRFLGIQFGSYPERFTYSHPISPSGDVSALEFGAICRQRDGITGIIDGSEDCLHLNIYTPFLPSSNSSTKLRPVMFWVSVDLSPLSLAVRSIDTSIDIWWRLYQRIQQRPYVRWWQLGFA